MSRKSPVVFDKVSIARAKLARYMVTAARSADPGLGEAIAHVANADPSNVAKVIEALTRSARGPSIAERVAAVRVLGQAANYAARYAGGSPPELLDALHVVADATSAKSEEIRIAAFNALEGFAADAGPDVVDAFTSRDYLSASAPEAIAAIHALRACGPDPAAAAVGWLASLLEHADVAVVELACGTLGWIGPEAADFIEQLTSLATGPNRQLRRAAANALIAIDPDGKVVAKEIREREQREAVLMALRETGAEGRGTTAKLSGKWAPTKATAGKRKQSADAVLMMRTALLQHHGFESGELHFEPASQIELMKLTGFGQTKVSRTMKTIFGKDPMLQYKNACRTAGGLQRYLQPPGAVRRAHKPIDKDD